MNNNWFDVSRRGLAKLVERKGKAFIIHELVQNSWDENTSVVHVRLTPQEGVPRVEIEVEDDNPEGFKDLSHAWTLYAESGKKGNPEQRGMYNLGEKLVLALCSEASITTTTGSVTFDQRGRTRGKAKRERGSLFYGIARMTRDEYHMVMDSIYGLLVPPGVATYVNGKELPKRTPIVTFEATLPTFVSDDEGTVKRTTRKTTVEVFEPIGGETPSIYEMGIPVVEIQSDRYHLNVLQKVPSNMDRDNVSPAYLRQLRALALNAVHDRLSKEEMRATWVTDATTDKEIAPQAVESMLNARFGERRVSYDPSDVEANHRAVAAGYTVVHGNSLPKETWEAMRSNNLIVSAGKVTPGKVQHFSADGKPVNWIPMEKWTEGMHKVVAFYQQLAQLTLQRTILVRIGSDAGLVSGACYGDGELILNKLRLGNMFFEEGLSRRVVALGIHELAHDVAPNHLSDKFHDECCRIGAELALGVATGRIKLS